ncbi:hypothetical protein EMMF5_000484 [Cystobasidiomycetes sp. EMM_F5]
MLSKKGFEKCRVVTPKHEKFPSLDMSDIDDDVATPTQHSKQVPATTVTTAQPIPITEKTLSKKHSLFSLVGSYWSSTKSEMTDARRDISAPRVAEVHPVQDDETDSVIEEVDGALWNHYRTVTSTKYAEVATWAKQAAVSTEISQADLARLRSATAITVPKTVRRVRSITQEPTGPRSARRIRTMTVELERDRSVECEADDDESSESKLVKSRDSTDSATDESLPISTPTSSPPLSRKVSQGAFFTENEGITSLETLLQARYRNIKVLRPDNDDHAASYGESVMNDLVMPAFPNKALEGSSPSPNEIRRIDIETRHYTPPRPMVATSLGAVGARDDLGLAVTATSILRSTLRNAKSEGNLRGSIRPGTVSTTAGTTSIKQHTLFTRPSLSSLFSFASSQPSPVIREEEQIHQAPKLAMRVPDLPEAVVAPDVEPIMPTAPEPIARPPPKLIRKAASFATLRQAASPVLTDQPVDTLSMPMTATTAKGKGKATTPKKVVAFAEPATASTSASANSSARQSPRKPVLAHKSTNQATSRTPCSAMASGPAKGLTEPPKVRLRAVKSLENILAQGQRQVQAQGATVQRQGGTARASTSSNAAQIQRGPLPPSHSCPASPPAPAAVHWTIRAREDAKRNAAEARARKKQIERNIAELLRDGKPEPTWTESLRGYFDYAKETAADWTTKALATVNGSTAAPVEPFVPRSHNAPRFVPTEDFYHGQPRRATTLGLDVVGQRAARRAARAARRARHGRIPEHQYNSDDEMVTQSRIHHYANGRATIVPTIFISAASPVNV